MPDAIVVRRLVAGEEGYLENVAEDVFDYPIKEHLAKEFLVAPHNLLVVALDDDLVIGMGSGMFHFHPDKNSELWINELGVCPKYHRRGIATSILGKMQELALESNCKGCWLLTEPDNLPANELYTSLPGWTGPEESVMYSLEFTNEQRSST